MPRAKRRKKMSKESIGIIGYILFLGVLLALILLFCGCGMKFQSPISFEQKAEKQTPINLPIMYNKLPAEAKPAAFKEICGIVAGRWERMDELEFRKPAAKGLSNMRIILIGVAVVGAVIWWRTKSSTGWFIPAACLGGVGLCTALMRHENLIGYIIIATAVFWGVYKLWEYKSRACKSEKEVEDLKNNKSPPGDAE